MLTVSDLSAPRIRFIAFSVLLMMMPAAFAQVVLPQQESNCLSCHSSTPATALNLVVDNVGSCDYADANLYAGWGWNSVLMQSCPPLDSPTADGAYAHDNTAQSESGNSGADNVATGGQVANGVRVCERASSDPDGDGWGWENNGSCIINQLTMLSDDDSGEVCIDSDGDGWGWNGSGSCRVGDVATVVPTPAPDMSVDTTIAAACVDSDGDGYGWNGTGTCIPSQGNSVIADDAPTENENSTVSGSCVAPAEGTTVVSTTGPVRSTGNSFYPDNGPQCVVPTNQFNGPGLGFGDFLMLNNAWNGDKSSWNWSQCISLTSTSGGSVVPSWTYDWGNEDALQPGYQEWEVKSYPEIVYGVKSQSVKSAPCATTGLPVPYNAMPDIDITYSYRAPQTNSRTGDLPDENNEQQTVTGGDRNIAIESFLHSSCDIKRGSDINREFELMVWLEHGAERLPSGSPPVSVYTDSDGRLYDVYVKGQADPGYIAYVAQQKSTSGTINWNEFFKDAKDNAGTYGVRAIDSNWCLANILFGSEIWWGEGSFALDYLQIQRSY